MKNPLRTPVLMTGLLTLFAGSFAVGDEWDEEAVDPHAHHRAMAKSAKTVRALAQYSIPDITMIDQYGAAVVLPELFDTDQAVMVNFIFTTCTAICPMMTSIFRQVQTRLGNEADNVLMVSVSIDPEQDSPEALAEYSARFRAGPQWRFLTGTLEDSIAVQQAFGAYLGDKMNHAPLTLMRGGGEAGWVRFDGFATAADLEAEYRNMQSPSKAARLQE